MTNETKRNNRASQVQYIRFDDSELASKLAEIEKTATESQANIYDVSDVIIRHEDGTAELDTAQAETHQLIIIPNYDSTDENRLVSYTIGLIPLFETILNSEIGLNYLKSSYYARVIKKIRDNLRIAINDNREFKLSRDVAEFCTTSRAGNGGGSEELKKAVAELCKGLIAKFAKSLPYAKSVLTQKNMLIALNNEQFAKSVYPFLITKDGNTILDKWLDSTIAKFTANGTPTAELVNIKEIRHTAKLETEEAETSLDDLF